MQSNRFFECCKRSNLSTAENKDFFAENGDFCCDAAGVKDMIQPGNNVNNR